MSATNNKIVTTCSFWRTFRNCREKANLRYNEELVCIETSEALHFGKLAHQSLEVWDRTRDMEKVLAFLRGIFEFTAPTNRGELELWLKLSALMLAYSTVYRDETVITSTLPDGELALECKFEMPIDNPDTGFPSKTFVLGGKIDRIVHFPERPDEHWVLERKTTSSITPEYLERLWIDFQNHLYVHSAKKAWRLNVLGVIYDIVAKPTIKLCGVSQKRKIEESHGEFYARLLDWYNMPEPIPEHFHRQRMEVTPFQLEKMRTELWDLSQQYLQAKSRKYFAQNTDACFHWGVACPYWKLCRSGKDSLILKSFYRHEPRNVELLERSYDN